MAVTWAQEVPVGGGVVAVVMAEAVMEMAATVGEGVVAAVAGAEVEAARGEAVEEEVGEEEVGEVVPVVGAPEGVARVVVVMAVGVEEAATVAQMVGVAMVLGGSPLPSPADQVLKSL